MFQEMPLTDEEFQSAVQVLRRLLPDEELDRLQPSGPATVYTTLVTLWMMVLQRLGGGKSLSAVVKDVLASNRDLLPDNKRLREGTLSENSAAFSQARTRLREETMEFFADRVCQSLIAASPPWFDGRRAFIIDGTTITLAPTDELRAAFPPAPNQHGESVWPVALLLVAHELQSSCALPPEIGAMYGAHNTSEARLARRLLARIPSGSLILADAGFGIFSVAHHAVQAGHAVLFRLTKSRFKALRRQAQLVDESARSATCRLAWTPTAKDRLTNPELPADAALAVLLHQVPLPGGEVLFLVTTLDVSGERAGEYYARRYDVEHDIRDVKVTLDTERIRAHSAAMVRKELLASIVAYNLVVQFRRQAAELAGVPPRRLSFTRVWNTFESFLLHQPPCTAPEWLARYAHALEIAARDKLPNRPGRSYPRTAHPRRPKSTKFMKQQDRQTTVSEKPPP
jgi:hypothetical protein